MASQQTITGVIIIPITSNPLKFALLQDIPYVIAMKVIDVTWDTTAQGGFNPAGQALFLSCPDFSQFGSSLEGRFGARIIPNIVASWSLQNNGGTFNNNKTVDQPPFELNFPGTRHIHELNLLFFDGNGNMITPPGTMNLSISFKQRYPVLNRDIQ